MALSQAQKRTIVRDALRDHIPYGGDGVDTRSLDDLRRAFEHRHLMGLVHSYRRAQADRALESFDIGDI